MIEKNLMIKFIEDRQKMNAIVKNIEYVDNGNRPHLVIKDISVLSSFMGYLKYQTRSDPDYHVLFRGQTSDYPKMLPSLYRGKKDRISLLVDALDDLRNQLKNESGVERFDKENIYDLFQHYGIKSDGIDVVDNIFVALWFSLMKIQCVNEEKNLYSVIRSKEDFGWIYFFRVEKTNFDRIFHDYSEIVISDLRREHSSLSMRLHCQHGYMLSHFFGKYVKDYSFDKYIIAAVKIPNLDRFLPQGELFSVKHFFPSKDFDNTYKIFSSRKFANLLARIETKHSLQKNELGNIMQFKYN